MSARTATRVRPRARRTAPTASEALHRHTEEAVALLKAIASSNRLLLLCQLTEGERSVGELADQLELAQSVVSQHLSLLRREGVVAGRRDGQSIFYRIADERTHALMVTLAELFCAEDES